MLNLRTISPVKGQVRRTNLSGIYNVFATFIEVHTLGGLFCGCSASVRVTGVLCEGINLPAC